MDTDTFPDRSLQQRMSAFATACKERDLKLTHQRCEIYQILLAAPDHPSAETIYQRLRERMPTVSLDTVYRTLATLEQHGLVKRVQTLENHIRFEAACLPHHHFLCERCKKLVDFAWGEFDRTSLPEEVGRLGHIHGKNVLIQGICHDCLQNRS